MPTANLTHLRRLAAVHRSIAAGGWNADGIAAAHRMNRRTVQRYMDTLRELGAAIVFDGWPVAWRYAEPFDLDAAVLRIMHAT